MTETQTNATFQQSHSEFAEIVRFGIKELVKEINDLEDHIYMNPQYEVERPKDRLPFQEFRRAFRDLFTITQHTVKNRVLVKAVNLWFKQVRYISESKYKDFTIGMEFAEQYLEEMYKLGLLDLNVAEAVDFPFADMVEDIVAENNRMKIMQGDIRLITKRAEKSLQVNLGDDAKPIEKLLKNGSDDDDSDISDSSESDENTPIVGDENEDEPDSDEEIEEEIEEPEGVEEQELEEPDEMSEEEFFKDADEESGEGEETEDISYSDDETLAYAHNKDEE